MKSVYTETLALKVAEALLLYDGEISMKDIEAIPFLRDPKDAELIASYLRTKYKTKISAARTQREEAGTWEELITLQK